MSSDEALLFPSPNWFLVSNFNVSKDGWFIYGGPNKSLCALVPRIPGEGVISGNNTYQAIMAPKAHNDRVMSVDISPEFPVKRNFISGAGDGSVKQWVIEKVNDTYRFKATHSHEVHSVDKEEIAGVGYSTDMVAITVGSFGKIVKWDLSSNVCKTYNKYMPSFKPTCMTCSPHLPFYVAVGTKQGVIFVLNLEGNGKIVYKVRSQDDEITNLSWCPQFELLANKDLKLVPKKSVATTRMEAIRNEPEKENVLEKSGLVKNLPEDSFDETVVEEDDMFDIYTDHAADEFGHKKYEPEDIVIKIKEEKKEPNDYLAECLRLKEEILKRKNQEEPTIESLVQALDKAHVDPSNSECTVPQAGVSNVKSECPEPEVEESKVKSEDNKLPAASVHVYKNLLASIGKFGVVRIWSKSGKLVASCALQYTNNKGPKNKVVSWPTLLWYKPDTLLLVDGKSQLLACNPLQINSKNKFEAHLVHALHKRGLFALASDAPRAQTGCESPESPDFLDSSKWSVFTLSQDRTIIKYNMATRRKVAVHNTCGGYLYNVQPCPYDAGKLAISVGDGAVRVWQTATLANDETKLYPAKVQTYWQSVQGKVLTVAWHPTRENTLAFGTAESRVGIIDTSGKNEKPARVLYPALNGGVYSLCWGEGMQLWACGGYELVVYDGMKDLAPKIMEIAVDGQKWSIGSMTYSPRGVLCGSNLGAVAVVDPTTFQVRTFAFAFTKLIHSMEWHPIQTSNSSEESQYQNLIAVSSLDKSCNIVILEYKDEEGGGKQLTSWQTLSGHKMPVLQLAWNPHREGLLVSTSQDTTARVWDISTGTCVSIYGGHSQHSLGVVWSPMPQLDTMLITGGGDFCLRLWDYTQHKTDDFQQVKHETSTKPKKAVKTKQHDESPTEQLNLNVAANLHIVRKPPKKFILSTLHRQMNPCPPIAVKKMFEKFVDEHAFIHDQESNEDYDLDFIKIFGSINDVNEVLDMEMANLLEDDFPESWITLSIFRGHIDSMIQFASKRDMLCPYLLTQAPCVSFKYWKEATQLYIAQIDRLTARGADDKLHESRHYGGAVFRKACTLLSIHDVKGAVASLISAKQYKEAYILCRIRYMDSIAQETLAQWAKDTYFSGNIRLSAICHIALGNLSEAASALAKHHDQETLSIAAVIAKAAGRNNFADHVQNKAQTGTSDIKHEKLEDLPSRIELLLLKDEKCADENGEKYGDELNGVSDNKIVL